MKPIKDGLAPEGLVEIFTTKGKPDLRLFDPLPRKKGFPLVHKRHELDFSKVDILDEQVIKNIVVNGGKDKTIESYSTGFIHVIARMAIGDRGALASDPTIPKVPVDTMDTLYGEVYRDDVDATVLDVGGSVHEIKLIKTFSALVIPITSFSDQANPRINEVGLVTADLLAGVPLPRAPVAAPATPDTDEELFAIRTFKSVPFEAANEIEITVRYTIFIA